MTGGILQLVANSSAQNLWLNHQPEITFFKKIFRRHTPFATEMIPIKIPGNLNFGDSTSVCLPVHGDLVHRIFLTFDIPKLCAYFPNTKIQDISKIISEIHFIDTVFANKIKQFINKGIVECDGLFNYIEEVITEYKSQKQQYKNIIQILLDQENLMDHKNALNQASESKHQTIDYESNFDVTTKYNSEIRYNFDDFKTKIMDVYMGQKKEYYLIYELVKLIYFSEKCAVNQVLIIPEKNLPGHLLYSEIFQECITHKEIIVMHFSKDSNFNQEEITKNFQKFANKSINLDHSDTSFFVHTNKITNVQDVSYNYGPLYTNITNNYTIISNLLKNMAKTIPIVIAKAFYIGKSYDIYNHCHSVPMIDKNFSIIIDPNFKSAFINSIIEVGNDSNEFTNPFIQLVQKECNTLFSNICQMMGRVFDGISFNSTSDLFFNNSLKMSNIYCYLVPTNNYKDQENLRIKNVFNANIWFFYFFKYLEYIDENIFTKYVNDTMFTLTSHGNKFMKCTFILLKMNIEYYMNEISYLLNDMYSNCPSKYSTDSMKNYVPCSSSNVINNIDIHNDLLVITLIFHRNNVPTILEIFQFIYHFISVIDVDKIKKNLRMKMEEIDLSEMSKIKNVIKLFYYQIFQYFMNVYDGFRFESASNFTTNEYDTRYNAIINKYVLYFLEGTGKPIKDQFSLKKLLNQMKFYFVVEMINMRQLQKFYSKLLNQSLISSRIGTESGHLMDLINITFENKDHTLSNIDQTRKYWDMMYQPNDLYYMTRNTDRYNGESYIDTNYDSRNYGYVTKILAPIPLPPNNPYGIDPRYYNHNYFTASQIINDTTNEITVNWLQTTRSGVNTLNSGSFELYDVDYFRIKHEFFYMDNLETPNLKIINEHQNLYHQYSELVRHFNKFYVFKSNLTNNLLHLTQQIMNQNYIFLRKNPELVLDYNKKLKLFMEYLRESLTKKTNLVPRELLRDICQTIRQFKQEIIFLPTVGDLKTNRDFAEKINIKKMNLIDKILFLQNNFKTQYFYYSIHYKKISKIAKYVIHKSKNILNLVLEIIGEIVGKKITKKYQIKKITPFLFFFPDIYHEQIKILMEFKTDMNDFVQNILETLVKYFKPGSKNILTIQDVRDFINVTFIKTRDIYNYCIEKDQYKYVKKKLSRYQPILLNKILFLNEIDKLLGCASDSYQYRNKVLQTITLAIKYGIDETEYSKYIHELMNRIFVQKKISHDQIYCRIKNDIDKFFLGSMTHQTLKDAIICDIFGNEYGHHHPLLEYSFKFISNEYYSYIYFFLIYARENKLSTNFIKNPFLTIENPKCQSVDNLADVLTNFMDFIWDATCQDFEMSIYVNDIHQKYEYQKTDRIKQKEIEMGKIVNMLNQNFGTISENSTLIEEIVDSNHANSEFIDSFVDQISEKNEIIKFLIDNCKEKIKIIHHKKCQVLNFKNKLHTILYRNKKAKMAWIRKLAHFLVEKITIKCGDEIYGDHISDWIEIFHQFSKNKGKETGYRKMIGHRQDLIVFDDEIKQSYTITLPLIFYFNKNIASAIPINVTNKKYHLNMKLRNMNDVLYKEEFSEFMDPDNICACAPMLNESYLMVEYVYLSNEERAIFLTNHLEYLVDELQYDVYNINNDNTIPIYKIDSVKKFINEKKLNDSCNIVPKKIYSQINYKDRLGLDRSAILGTPSVDNIYKKKIVLENYFKNPAKLMAVLIKPLIHTIPDMRCDCKNYFYGEKQWDNYGLHSRYDLSIIENTKLDNYNHLKNKLNNPDDSDFGFINVVNQLLLKYSGEIEESDPTDKFIRENIACFLENLQKIKDVYNNYYGPLFYRSHFVEIRERLMSLKIDYDVYNSDVLCCMVRDVCTEMNCSVPDDWIKEFRGDRISKKCFVAKMEQMLGQEISIIHKIYDKYNESQINYLISEMVKYYDNMNAQDLKDSIYYFYNLCAPLLNRDIVAVIQKIMNYMSKNEICFGFKTRAITFKDIIYQILGLKYKCLVDFYDKWVPNSIIDAISYKMAQKVNEILNNLCVDIINYQKNMIPNPKTNPLISGHLKLNGVNIMPKNACGMYWSQVQAYQYIKSTPSTGINFYIWSLDPSSNQPNGSLNLTRINKFTSVYCVDPSISNNNPAMITTMIMSINIIRYLSGLSCKAWP